MSGVDSTLEVDNKELLQTVLVEEKLSNQMDCFVPQLDKIKHCNFYIITVPTPVDKNNRPILSPLLKCK